MTAGTDALKRAWRFFKTEGVPATGIHEPQKPEIHEALDSLALDIVAAGSGGDPNAVRAVIEPIRDDAVAAAGFSLRSSALAFAPKMANGEMTTVYGEAANATRAAVAGEVRLDGTAATVGEQIPLNGRYTWNGTALLRTGSTTDQLAALQRAAAEAAAANADAATAVNVFSLATIPVASQRYHRDANVTLEDAKLHRTWSDGREWRKITDLQARIPELLPKKSGWPGADIDDGNAKFVIDMDADYYRFGNIVYGSYAEAVAAGAAIGASKFTAEWTGPAVAAGTSDVNLIQVQAVNGTNYSGNNVLEYLVDLTDGSAAANRLSVRAGTTATGTQSSSMRATSPSGTQVFLGEIAGNDSGGYGAGRFRNVAGYFESGSYSFRGNGQASGATGTSGTRPSGFTSLYVGRSKDGTAAFTGVVRRIVGRKTADAVATAVRYNSQRLRQAAEYPNAGSLVDSYASANFLGPDGMIYMNFCNRDGEIGLAQIDPIKRRVIATKIFWSAFRALGPSALANGDDHNPGTDIVDLDGRMIKVFNPHNSASFPNFYVAISNNGTLEGFGPPVEFYDDSDRASPRTSSYGRLFLHKATGDIFFLGRMSNLLWSIWRMPRGGTTFTFLRHLARNSGQFYSAGGWSPLNADEIWFWTYRGSEGTSQPIKMFKVNVVTGDITNVNGVVGSIYGVVPGTAAALDHSDSGWPNWATPPANYTMRGFGGKRNTVDWDAASGISGEGLNDGSQINWCYLEYNSGDPLLYASWRRTVVSDAGEAPLGIRAVGAVEGIAPGLNSTRVYVGRTLHTGPEGDRNVIEQWDRAGVPGTAFTRTKTVYSYPISGNNCLRDLVNIPSLTMPIAIHQGMYQDYILWDHDVVFPAP